MIQVGGKNIAVVIYSTDRAETSDTLKWLDVPNVYLCIPEGQAELYKTQHVTKIIHPDNINRLPLKIEWVWEYFRGKADCCVKFDDDIAFVRDMGAYYYTDKDIERFSRLDAEEFLEVVANLYTMSKDLGAYIFSFGNVANYIQYSSGNRFKFAKAFDASFMGYIYEDKIKVDTSIKVKNEYDLQLQSLFYYGKMLTDCRYRQVQYDMFKNANGGLAKYRTTQVEDEAKMFLRNKWGDNVKFGGIGWLTFRWG